MMGLLLALLGPSGFDRKLLELKCCKQCPTTIVFPLHNSLVGEVVYFAVPERFHTAEKLTGNLASPTSGTLAAPFLRTVSQMESADFTWTHLMLLVKVVDTNVFARQYAVQASITGGIAPARRELSRPRPASIATSFALYQHRLALHLSSKSDVGGRPFKCPFAQEIESRMGEHNQINGNADPGTKLTAWCDISGSASLLLGFLDSICHARLPSFSRESSGDTFTRTTAAEKDVSHTDKHTLFESASDSDEGSAGRKLLFHGVRVKQVR
ncbi:hypothetical protein B0H14DRAFT_2633320 [Mycena olivaceomarginata]|nr:hypothetical protein B0H14DRAFT_2633320 [Mycena olivaceomarginata]